MIQNYYTLRALVREWSGDLTGCLLGDAYSQARAELTMAFAGEATEWMLRVRTQPPYVFVLRSVGYNRARRNVATLFEAAFGRRVEGVRIADRDRVVFIDLEGGAAFRLLLYGPRPNVLLADKVGRIVEAFQDGAALRGTPAPDPSPAPQVEAFDAFKARWRTDRKTAAQALTSAFPLFDRLLAAEALHRAGLAADAPARLGDDALRSLFEAARSLEEDLQTPAPRVYWQGRFVEVFALVQLRHLPDALRPEAFDTVDEAVRVFVRRTLAQRRFRSFFDPLEDALRKAHEEHRRRAERMLEELAHESRADRYERWGHLLMAAGTHLTPGADAVTLPDLFEATGDEVVIPLDPTRNGVENAQRYYDKARRTRAAREQAETRLLAAEEQAAEAGALLAVLQEVDSYADLQAFQNEQAERLAAFVGSGAGGAPSVPFRRYVLGGGFEVWVGRNARQNDELTFHHAQKHDLWMHARGVPGSHAVLRLPNKQAKPDRRLLERAAAIAAYYSKARGSGLVPVMVAPRKYVRKPRGAAPGAVAVEREEVLLVEPGLPA